MHAPVDSTLVWELGGVEIMLTGVSSMRLQGSDVVELGDHGRRRCD